MISEVIKLLACLMLLGLLAVGFAEITDADEIKPRLTKYDRIHAIFDATGSKHPAVMAVAALATKRPDIITGIAVKESNGTPYAVGDGGKSKGAWQVQAQHWGKVPVSAVAQALQADRILDELVAAEQRGVLRWRKVLATYNGGPRRPRVSYAYADRVLRIARIVG